MFKLFVDRFELVIVKGIGGWVLGEGKEIGLGGIGGWWEMGKLSEGEGFLGIVKEF